MTDHFAQIGSQSPSFFFFKKKIIIRRRQEKKNWDRSIKKNILNPLEFPTHRT
jgi:hypothetical protein